MRRRPFFGPRARLASSKAGENAVSHRADFCERQADLFCGMGHERLTIAGCQVHGCGLWLDAAARKRPRARAQGRARRSLDSS
jgi:hypothetical protein